MSLTRQEFNILTTLQANRPVEIPESLLSSLSNEGFIENGKITADGINAIEPYRVKRAVFLAAGFGSRLVPITLNTPKPLIRVNGKRIIDGLLDAVLKTGIEEIIIVRGYLKEQFDQLLNKYPTIKFIDNDLFNEANNISSAICAKDLLKGAYVFEADLLISNPEIITPYQYSSNFLGIKVSRSDDWVFTVENGIIKEQKIGGINCYQEVGISYWDERDGEKLSNHLSEAYSLPGGKEFYWDQIPFKVFPNEYKVELRECKQSDIVEIDTFRELKAIDKAYDI